MTPTADTKTVALIYGFPLTAGGVESHLLSLVRHGTNSEFRFLFVGTAGERFRREARRLNVPMAEWGGPKWKGDLAAAFRLVRVLRENRVDLVHVHSPRGFLQVALAAGVSGIPVVSTVHLPVQYLIQGHGVVARYKVAVHHLAHRIVLRRLVARTIFASLRVCRESVSRKLVLSEKATVIRNGIELDRFRGPGRRDQVRREMGVPENEVVACFVGRLEPQKGVDVLIGALDSLDLGRLGFHVWVVGDGSLRSGLEEQARAHGLRDRVRFLSYRQDVERFLGASDLFVLPSRFEAAPIALVEAMAAGLPSVVTDVGDNADLVEHGVLGLVVPPEDVNALAVAIEKLARDPDGRRRMGAAARVAASQYSAQVTASAVEGVYRATLGVAGR